MSDEDALIRERNRAHQARIILDSPLWEESFQLYEDRLREHYESPANTDEIALEARRGLIALRRVRKHMETIFNTGKLADIELERSNG